MTIVPADQITATLVPHSTRLNCLPRHFGRRMIAFESAVYRWMGLLSQHYKGGFWNFYELSNQGLYMAPTLERLPIESPNGFCAEVSTDAAGVIACLFSFSHLSFEPDSEVFARHFHLLRDFAIEHAERSAILDAID